MNDYNLVVINNNVKNVTNSLVHRTKENIKVTIEESPWKWLKLMIYVESIILKEATENGARALGRYNEYTISGYKAIK